MVSKIILGCLVSIALIGGFAFIKSRPQPAGCVTYTPARNPLVAHAGGGLPNAIYANNVEAMDLAAKHGFRFIELDFVMIDGRLVLGHDEQSVSDTSMTALAGWMARHPDVSIVTDMKSGNSYLPLLKRALGTERVIPQIYHPNEFSDVKKLGYDRIIFTAYLWRDDGWREDVNNLDLWAVTLPKERWRQSKGVRHPI